jgi:hypothetical protein
MVALAKLVSAFGEARILLLPDPLLPASNRQVLIGAALVEICVAGYLMYGVSAKLKYFLTGWLASCFILYRVFIWELAPAKPCPCLGTITSQIPISPRIIDFLLKVIIIYMFVGSLYFLTLGQRLNPLVKKRSLD